jgi:hypothetical protein
MEVNCELFVVGIKLYNTIFFVCMRAKFLWRVVYFVLGLKPLEYIHNLLMGGTSRVAVRIIP